MGDVKTERKLAAKWLGTQASKPESQAPVLQRPVFLVTGYTDEDGNCWQGKDSLTRYGGRIYANWDDRAHMIVFPRDDVLGPRFGPLEGRAMDSFIDFGDLLREMMLELEPQAAATDDGDDVICHSMGGLDTVCALMNIIAEPPRTPAAPAASTLGKIHDLMTLDTPFRGVPSMDFRRTMGTTPAQERQGAALFRESPELGLVQRTMRDIPARVSRLTCYRPEGSAQLEVPMTSSDLYGTDPAWAAERAATHYEAVVIRGASHSGDMGITRSPITIRHIFESRLGV